MKLKTYFEYLKLYNRVLKKKNYYQFSVYNLNIIRYHPNYLNFSKKSFNKKARYSFNVYKKKIDEAKYLFISNIFNNNKKENHIFKQISKNLNKNETHFLFRNFTGRKLQFKSSKKTIANIYPSIISDFFYFYKVFIEIIKIIFLNLGFHNQKYLKSLLTLKNFKSSISNLYEVSQLISVITKVRPTKIFISFEGYSWERMLVYQIKKFNPQIITYGYFFSIISKYQNSPFIKYGKKFDFDFILTSGIPQKNKFIRHGFEKDKIITIGKEFHKKKNFNKNYLNNNNCIILPESFENEIFFMIDFIKNYIKKKKNITFYIKLHPSITDPKLKQKIKSYLDNKITILKNSDKIRFRYAIFRGSSSIIDYVNQGSIPIYLKKKNEPDLSPLYEVGKEIKYVLNVNDIQNLFNETNINKNSKKLRNYSKNYFLELNKTKLKTILK